jgi:hypothetical protein
MFKRINRNISFLAPVILAALARTAGAAVPAAMESNMQALGESARYTTTGVTETSLFTYLGALVQVFLGVLGVIFVGLFIAAGYSWMMAGGDTAKIDKAKDSMWRAVIGLLIIIGAYAIQQYVFGRL